ncbi:uncharacterized protein LOC110266443 [Arachis ipaensis]|uniref:uncharacterized protein LOC110266443 n=1 Tax=Arachis ipaensis TaxID=130454 RepID=UPI000A2B5B20|nr:uncharacterized protein LOC110266443 [Arachis ipaensis]XP_025628559.1 uncharacterized protein LOC112721738 [Arachis hypogaea]
MAPYEALYGHKCQSLLCWYEGKDSSMLEPELFQETTEKIKRICERILAAQSRQKSYVDRRRKLLEFNEGDYVFLKLRKYNPEESHVLEPETVQLRDDLTFQVPPVQIVDRSIKQLRGKEVPLVKVVWGRDGMEEHT